MSPFTKAALCARSTAWTRRKIIDKANCILFERNRRSPGCDDYNGSILVLGTLQEVLNLLLQYLGNLGEHANNEAYGDFDGVEKVLTGLDDRLVHYFFKSCKRRWSQLIFDFEATLHVFPVNVTCCILEVVFSLAKSCLSALLRLWSCELWVRVIAFHNR